jgi:hypothetical protein
VIPITLNGTGISAGGALRNLANNNTWSGTVTLGAAARINSDAGNTNNWAPASWATNQNLTVGGLGNTAINGAIATGSGTLTKDGAGTLTFVWNKYIQAARRLLALVYLMFKAAPALGGTGNGNSQ